MGRDVNSNVTLLDFIRQRANLLGTKFMCLEAGCGACIVSVIKTPGTAPVAVNAVNILLTFENEFNAFWKKNTVTFTFFYAIKLYIDLGTHRRVGCGPNAPLNIYFDNLHAFYKLPYGVKGVWGLGKLSPIQPYKCWNLTHESKHCLTAHKIFFTKTETLLWLI